MTESRRVVVQLPAKVVPLTPTETVRRALPRRELRRVGPFVFLDSFGPAPAAMNVPEHPHVGLETMTYLFSGSIRHTDSIGSDQPTHAGDVNWMSAGRGISHAEHALPGSAEIEGVQTWVALPHAGRRSPPAFAHVDAASVPRRPFASGEVRVAAGRLGDLAAPRPPGKADALFLDVAFAREGAVELPVDPAHELAVYVARGDVTVGDAPVLAGTLARLEGPGPAGNGALALAAAGPARLVVVGGAPMPEPTVIHWNFVVESVADGRAFEEAWRRGDLRVR